MPPPGGQVPPPAGGFPGAMPPPGIGGPPAPAAGWDSTPITVAQPTTPFAGPGGPGGSGKASRTSLYVVLGLVVAIVVAVVGVVVFTGGDDDGDGDARTDDTEAVEDTEADDTEPDDTEPDTTVAETTSPDTVAETTEPATTAAAPPTTAAPAGDVIAGAPVGVQGTPDAPVAVGEIADIGAGWRLQVLDVVPDATAAVAAENSFNDPPPAGGTFTLVRVALGYFGLDDPQSFFMPTISAVGASRVELDTGCGVIPQPIDLFTDAFAGGVGVGNLCFVTTPADPPALMLYGTGDFFSDTQVFLDAKQPPAPVPPMAPVVGAQPGATATALRTAATPVGTSADVGEGWSFSVVAPARDITDQVMAENSFNDPPPEGYRMLGVDVAIAYSGAGTGSAFDLTTKFVGDGNVQRNGYCGVVPNELDTFADVLSGGSLTGTMCFLVPAPELTNGVLYVTAGFDTDPIYFATL